MATQSLLCSVLVLCAISYMASAHCTAGEVRLEDNNLHSGLVHSGVVEVCNGNMFGRVCVDGFDVNAATVVCRQLGLAPAPTDSSGMSPLLENPVADIFDLNLSPESPAFVQADCSGTEMSLTECVLIAPDPEAANCEPAAIICILDVQPCCLRECSSNEMCVNGDTLADTTCTCIEGFTEVDGTCVECEDDSMCPDHMECVDNTCEPWTRTRTRTKTCKHDSKKSCTKKSCSKKRGSKKRGSRKRDTKSRTS